MSSRRFSLLAAIGFHKADFCERINGFVGVNACFSVMTDYIPLSRLKLYRTEFQAGQMDRRGCRGCRKHFCGSQLSHERRHFHAL
ncbi:hypothetical protein OS035_33205, partial [Rhizobium sp. 268]|uniref:hypothetical protein n=1 Tax=Rhizobium sp. 268 TaxID=2996375 RepID=UPI002F958F4E